MPRRLLSALVLLAAGCRARDADLLSQVLHRTGHKAQAALGGAPGQLVGRMRGTLASDASLASRVQLRLRWDRHLEGVEVEVHNPEPGVVSLRGVLADAFQKRRVLDLAQSTAGVERVEDELTLTGGGE